MMRLGFITLLLIVLLAAALPYLRGLMPDKATSAPAFTVSDALREGDTQGFARALAVRTFSFPRDHGPHPDYKQEWWYFTGNLETEQGRHFGFQLTFFRIGLSPSTQARASAWATREVYMAHFTVSDVEKNKFYHFERFSRPALGLAGASAAPFKVWLENWSAQGTHATTFPLRLHAVQDDIAIDLQLQNLKPIVLQGDHGLSQKSSEPGNASYYYSLTRLASSGTLRIGAQSFKVSGLSWMDREWSSSALGSEQIGWDWFSLQFSDGRELMFYRLRRKDGGADPFSAGTLVHADGTTEPLRLQEVRIEVSDYWKSPQSGVRYPSRWRVHIPRHDLQLDVVPYLAGQELNVTVRYWEGAVHIKGSSYSKPLTGSGYVELAGYE